MNPPATPEPDDSEALIAERLRHHRRVLTSSVGFTVLLALALVYQAQPVEHPMRVGLWCALLLVAVAGRMGVRHWHVRRSSPVSRDWLLRYRAGLLAHGLAWAALVWALPADRQVNFVVPVVLLLVALGNLVSTFFDLRGALAFALPVCAALSAHLLGMSRSEAGVAVVLVPPILLMAALVHALRSQRVMQEGLLERRSSALAREELAESHHQMAQLLGTTPVGYWFIDRQGLSTQVNPAMCALLGRSADQIIGRPVREFFGGAALQRLDRELSERDQGKAGVYEVELERPDGSRVYCINNATPLYNRAGERIGSVGLWTDISERRIAEQAQRTYQFVVNSTRDMVSVIDERRIYQLVNNAWVARAGVSREQVIGRDLIELGVVPLSEKRRLAFQRCLDTGTPQVVREVAAGSSFDGLSVESTYYPYADPGAELRSVVVVTRDMTAEERQSALLAESERYLWNTLNATGDAIFASDAKAPDEPVRFCNDEMLRMWDLDPAHRETITPAEIMRHAGRLFVDPQGEAALVAKLIATNARHESKVHLTDGRVLLRRCNPVVVRERVVRVWSFRDITSQESATALMQLSRDEADRANRAKNEFLGNVSHELRTPLNAILGFAEILSNDRSLPAPSREAAGHIQAAGGHLLALVDDMIDLVRIESGRVAMNLEAVRLGELLSDCVALSMPLARTRSVKLRADLDGARGLALQADPVRLRQVLINLLSNAIKYNRVGGEVRIATGRREGRVRVSVLDTGAGIAPEFHSRVFTPFDRLGEDRGPVEGTGIGLVICQHLIRAMGGEIGFDSEPGRGSVFWFELPVPSSAGSPATPA